MCPPLAAVAALILLWIELTKALTVRIGMLFHSSINAFLSCARVAGISALPNPTVQLIPLVLCWGQIKSVRYRDEILRPVAVPLVQQRNLILQQDNARPHVARVCQHFLANNNIAPLAWPPYSPALTPIEHMWDELDRRVRKRRNPPATLAQLRNALIDEWNNIPMRTVNALFNSIQRRIRAATAARGGTPDIDFQFDFDFKIWGVATNELQ